MISFKTKNDKYLINMKFGYFMVHRVISYYTPLSKVIQNFLKDATEKKDEKKPSGTVFRSASLVGFVAFLTIFL